MTNARGWLVALSTMTFLACSGGAPTGGAATTSLCPETASTKTVPAAGAPLTEVTSFGANPANLQMFVHAPSSGTVNAVVVAMHGCTQTANAYLAAGWNDLADAAGFVVVYPQQTSANNIQECFRWFDSANITRGQGEAQSIASMTDYARTTYGASKAYVTGLSAGAAMTAVMLATYPDLFEAGAIMSGIPYACATSQVDAFTCTNPGKDQTPSAWGALVPKLTGASAPRVMVWQGDTDYTVVPKNLDQIVRQWTDVNGIAATPASTTTVGKATHEQYTDSAGNVRVDSWLIAGMGHGVSIDPTHGCGTAAAYVLDEGLCSTREAAKFFGLLGATGADGGTSSSGGSSSGASGSSSGGGSSSSGGASSSGGGCP